MRKEARTLMNRSRPRHLVGFVRSAAPYLILGGMTIAVPLYAALTNAGAVTPTYLEERRTPEALFSQLHADALQAFHEQRYSAAYGRFAALADDGHAPSAVMALTMASQGAAVFGSDWSATPGQLQHWSALAAREVRDRGAEITETARGE